MYIPRPAKLLFQHDDGWSKYLDKHGDSLNDWTKLAVERMLACGTCLMGVRRYCCASSDCTHARFFCQSCKSKACSSCGLKATEQWIAEQQHILPDCDWQHITFTMPHLLWPFFNNNWPLLNDLFRCAINPGSLPGFGHIRNEDRWYRYLHAQYRRAWKVHFAKKTRACGAA